MHSNGGLVIYMLLPKSSATASLVLWSIRDGDSITSLAPQISPPPSPVPGASTPQSMAFSIPSLERRFITGAIIAGWDG